MNEKVGLFVHCEWREKYINIIKFLDLIQQNRPCFSQLRIITQVNEKVYFIVRQGKGWLWTGHEVRLKGLKMIRRVLGKGFENAGQAWKIARKGILGGGWLLILFYYLPDHSRKGQCNKKESFKSAMEDPIPSQTFRVDKNEGI